MSATIAMILISANQNSISPNAATVGRFSASRMTITRTPGIHNGMPGISASVYPAIAITSATPVTTQQNQYVHPVKKPAHGPSRSLAKSLNDLYLRFDSSSSPIARITKKSMKPMIM